MSSALWNDLMAQLEGLQSTFLGHDAINKLPTELLLDIFQDLDQPDLASTARVCRRWNDIVVPILYETMNLGVLGQSVTAQERMLRGLADLTFINDKLRSLVRHVKFKTSAYLLSEEEIQSHFFPSMETLQFFSLDRECDTSSYTRAMYSCTFGVLKKLHIGLRCDAAEARFPQIFAESNMASRLPCLEEFRYSRLRTRVEAARMGEYHSDENLIVDDHLGGGPFSSVPSYTIMQSQLFSEQYVHYLSAVTSLKCLNLDLGVSPASFIDLRRTSLPDNFLTISNFLGPTIPELSPEATRGRDKLLRLTHVQFADLVTDVSDEINRRTAEAEDLGFRTLTVLPPVALFRNQARAKLSTLKLSRLRDLAMDTRYQLLRLYPRLSRPPSPYSFELAPVSENSALNERALVDRVRNLQRVDKLSRDWSIMKLLRDMQKDVVPLIYQCVEEAGLTNIQRVRVRLILDGPWIEVFVQKAEGEAKVELYSLFPGVTLTETESLGLADGKWGVYVLYEDNRRVSVKVALLRNVEGKWGIQVPPPKPGLSNVGPQVLPTSAG